MKDLQTLISEVEELDARSTPGPWETSITVDRRRGSVFQDGHVIASFGPNDDSLLNKSQKHSNHEAIAHYRQSAPRLARICVVMQEALFVISRRGAGPFAGGENERHAAHVAKTAIAEADRLAKGGA